MIFGKVSWYVFLMRLMFDENISVKILESVKHSTKYCMTLCLMKKNDKINSRHNMV